MQTANNHVVVIPQIESVRGVENALEIASVDNVGGLMFGPGDFMADAGIPITMAGPPHPVMVDAMTKFAEAGAKAGVPLLGYVLSLVSPVRRAPFGVCPRTCCNTCKSNHED